MKRLSVIIPMYNVEPYVERCLLSIVRQDIDSDELEVICINDGSPDKSKDIVLRLQGKFDNIKLIDQTNQGVSQARNNGIKEAQGQYLLFVDPDDYVEVNSFARILSYAENLKAQVSFLGFSYLELDGSVKKRICYDHLKSRSYAGTEAYFLSRGDGRTDPDRMWAVLYKRSFILEHNLLFLPGVPYLEDGELIARVLCLASNCIFDEHMFYWRTTRPGSATNSKLNISDAARMGFIKSAINLRDFRNAEALTDKQKVFLNQPIAKFVVISISTTSSLSKFKDFILVNRNLKMNNFGKLSLEGCGKNYKKWGSLYNTSAMILFSYFIVRPYIKKVWGLFR